MSAKIDRVLNLAITMSAVAIAATAVYRAAHPGAPIAAGRELRFVPNWKDALPIGHHIGAASPSVTIVEVADLECPVCKIFQRTVREVLDSFPSQVAIVHVPFPLSYHKQAMAAARAGECAADRGRFAEWVNLVYAKQDSLGTKSWGQFAHEAGIADTAAIGRCARDTVVVSRIAAGLAFGHKISIPGTPAVLVNGWLLPAPPTFEQLAGTIRTVERGGDPFAKGHWAQEVSP